MLEELDHRPRDLLYAGVVSRRAAHPVEDLEVWVVGDERDVEAARPVQAVLLRKPPGVPLALRLLERLRRRAAQLTHPDLVPTHVRDEVHGAHAEGADVVASVAGGARPQGLCADHISVE